MIAADPMAPRSVAIRGVTRETGDTVTLRLEPPGGAPLRFAPGQFNMLHRFGAGEVAMSISGDPARDGELSHTIRGVGSVTRPMLALRRGERVGVRGPFGTAWPLDEARGGDVVVIAGGLGLAPLRPAIYRLLAERDRYRRVAILAGAREPASLPYRRELARWRRRRDLALHLAVDRPDPGWRGAVGLVTALLPRLALDANRTVALLCGPEPMMRGGARDLERLGVPRHRIFVSLERNMKCGVGWCGHCQLGPLLLCRDGPVVRWDRVGHLLDHRDL